MNGQRSERSECFGRVYETHSQSCARSTSAEHVSADALASRRHMNEPLASVLQPPFLHRFRLSPIPRIVTVDVGASLAISLAAGVLIEHAKRSDSALLLQTPASPLVLQIAEASAKNGAPGFIAHAAGELDGHKYLNTEEALNASLAAGYRYIELDLKKTLSGRFFGAHSVLEFNDRTGAGWSWRIPPVSERAVRERRIDGRYTPLFLSDLNERVSGDPNGLGFVLVVDKTDDYEGLLKAFPHPERMIVETGTLAEYAEALRAGITTPALAVRHFHEALTSGVRAVVVDPRTVKSDPAGAALFRHKGGIILAATVEDCRAVGEDPTLSANVDLEHVDRCEAPTNEMLNEVKSAKQRPVETMTERLDAASPHESFTKPGWVKRGALRSIRCKRSCFACEVRPHVPARHLCRQFARRQSNREARCRRHGTYRGCRP